MPTPDPARPADPNARATQAPPRRKRLTLRDVAAHCGVSVSTVSMALNAKDVSCTLSEATRDRIRAEAKTLGYRPNWRARAMRQQVSMCVGLFYESEAPKVQGVYDDMVSRFNHVLRDAGYHLLFLPLDRDTWADAAQGQQIDGFAMLQHVSDDVERDVIDDPLPGVVMNAAPIDRVSVINIDDHLGARLAVEHLGGLGHRRVAFLTASHPTEEPHISADERLRGYRDTLAGLPGAGPPDVVRDGDAALAAVRERGATAVVCYSDREAVPLLQRFWNAGLTVGRDVSVVAFNELDHSRYQIPALTTVAVPAGEVGHRSGTRLLQLMRGEPIEGDRVVRLRPHLIERDSTGPAPA